MTSSDRSLRNTIAILLVGMAIVATLFPIYWTVTTALKTQRATFETPPQLIPSEPTLEHFATVTGRPDFISSFVTSLSLTATSTILCLLIGGLAAYALTRFRFPGASLLQSAILVMRILPAIALVVPLYKIFAMLGILDNLAAIVLVYTAINIPFAVWLLASFLSQIPIDLEEAGQIDGASRLQVLRLIVAPLAAPGIMATGLFVAILAWNEFLVPVILGTRAVRPLSVLIASFVGSRSIEWGELAAAASMAIIPILLLSLMVQRYLVSGLTLGALKE